MNIIKLHNTIDNSVVLVNADDIVCVDTVNDTDKRCSKIYLRVNDIKPFDVNETPEKIFSMLSTQVTKTKQQMIMD